LLKPAQRADGVAEDTIEGLHFLFDSKGLLREGVEIRDPHKRPLAVSRAVLERFGLDKLDNPSPVDVIRAVKPTVLIGATAQPGTFRRVMIEEMAKHCERPLVMPLSNPTSHAEITPSSALRWTEGRAIVASGSPFAPVDYDGEQHIIGQANNMFVFPGIGLGVQAVGAKRITDRMFLAAARALASTVTEEQLKAGQIYPAITSVRDVSWEVARATASQAISEGIADAVDDLDAVLAAEMWSPEYLPYRPA
ncbi:MAG: malic enzyme-like NAD(P)-binding protein, partial [Acidimicrobiia bacterium]